MANTENKTKPTDAKVSAYIAALDNPARRSDAERMLEIYSEVTGLDPVLWGPSIIGFGSYHYKYDSGREGDSGRAGFSPRKASLSLYLMSGYSDCDAGTRMAALRNRLGRHKTGASCLYVNKLADVDMDVLREMIALDWERMNGRYPV
jgi:Domain of unknown function (DU1801)